MHALTVTADLGVEFAIEKEDVENHGLDAAVVVEGRLVGKSADVLQDLGPDGLISADRIPRRIRVIGEGVEGEGSELLRMPDEFQVLGTEGGIRVTGLAQNRQPLGMGGMAEQEEGLPAQRATA